MAGTRYHARMTTTSPPTDQQTAADPLYGWRQNREAEEHGVWRQIGEDQFLIARLGNSRVRPARIEFLATIGLGPDQDIPPSHVPSWNALMFGRTILLDIRFAQNPETRYTHQMGERIWASEDLRDLREKILAYSQEGFTMRALGRHAILGNSEPCSNGSASTADTKTP